MGKRISGPGADLAQKRLAEAQRRKEFLYEWANAHRDVVTIKGAQTAVRERFGTTLPREAIAEIVRSVRPDAQNKRVRRLATAIERVRAQMEANGLQSVEFHGGKLVVTPKSPHTP